jgi:PAS domain S-box-containing protein
MDDADKPEGPVVTAAQVNDFFDSVDLTQVVKSEEFRQFLDHIPIAVVISKLFRGDQRICYANEAFEKLTGRTLADFAGRGWAILNSFRDEKDQTVTLAQAMLQQGGDFLGTFRSDEPKPLIVQAFLGLIEEENGAENYRIAALIDVTDRAQAEREEFERQIRDKDTLLREVQHRVKNNLQLIVALVRLEARAEKRGDRVNLAELAGRIESLYLIYHALSSDLAGNEIDLGHYVSQIASAVMNTYAVDGIRVDIKVEHAPTSINIALPVGLIVNELLTNSFKHAFGGRGHGLISVWCLRHGENRYRVIVADDGIGMPDGVTWPVPGKIGALVVQSLRENTKTDLNVESAHDRGVRVTITFEHKLPLHAAPHPDTHHVPGLGASSS